MADLTIFEKYPDSWRIDHPTFEDVRKSPYAVGVITAFYEANGDDPVVVKNVCDLTIGGQEFKEVPIFYHPPKAYAENWKLNAEPSIHAFETLMSDSAAWADFWKASGALVDAQGKSIADMPKEGLPFEDQTIARAAYSFSVGDEVAVMLKEGEPVAVIGFADGVPRRPFDYMQVEMPPQVIDSSMPENIGDPHCPYILQLSDSNRNVTPSGPNPGSEPPIGGNLGPDGFDLKLLKDAKIFPDKAEHSSSSSDSDLLFDWNYYCFYAGMDSIDISLYIALYDSDHWNPVPDPAFGPFYGYMHYGALWNIDIPDWATYLARWKDSCDTIQQQEYVEGSWQDKTYLGLWPSIDGETSLGRPLDWGIAVWNGGHSNASEDFVMRTYLLEAGPMLYIIRVFYYHYTNKGTGSTIYLWKNRIIWPFVDSPPSGWSGYPPGDYSGWTAPIWPFSGNPVPTTIEECNPPPDDSLPGENINMESFYADNPHYIYAAPSSKKILDNIESIIAESNAKVDVQAVQQGTSYDSVQPPEGFRNIFGPGVSYGLPPGFIPYVGNLRELNFKIAARIGVS
jgi:hypothetical protein